MVDMEVLQELVSGADTQERVMIYRITPKPHLTKNALKKFYRWYLEGVLPNHYKKRPSVLIQTKRWERKI